MADNLSDNQQSHFQCRIEGLDCPDCLSSVEKAVNQLAGVSGVQVNFPTRSLTARIDSPWLGKEIEARLHALGYEARTFTTQITSSLRVEGMCCSEEKRLVEKALSSLPGLGNLEINLVNKQLTIQHDPELLPISHLIQALAEVGLSASQIGSSEPKQSFIQTHIKSLSTLLAALLTVSGLLFSFLAPDSSLDKLCFGLAICSGGWFIFRKGVLAARYGSLDMNVLMSVAIIGALFIDAWDEAATVVVLFALAQALEGRAMDRTRRAVESLMELTPTKACVIRQDKEISLVVDEVNIGDIFRLRPGDKIPLDGVVISGNSAVNQAPITGESIPVEKSPGDTVFAGTINSQGSLDVRATHLANDTTLAHITHLIDEAQATRAPTQTLVDRFAAIYTPAVLGIALLIATLPPLMFNEAFSDWFYRALVLLVIACPCALVISTPVAIVTGLARGARAGVLFKGGIHLENTGHLKAIAFDKTGTLTRGEPKVIDCLPLGDTSQQQLLQIAASLESRSEHPLAQAILNYARLYDMELTEVDAFNSLGGLGVAGIIDGNKCQLGNPRLFDQQLNLSPEIIKSLLKWEDEGKTVVLVSRDSSLIGALTIGDTLRPEAKETLQSLHHLGIYPVTLLTGDNRGTAQAIAKSLGIESIRAELLPADKVAAVQTLVGQHQHVGMVGDGINDAPALTVATTGIAMGAAGSDVALESADLILMGDDLSRLPFAIRLSRSTLQIIKQNILLAVGLKALFLALAIPGLATLWMAVFADMGASLLVIFNSLRLIRLRDDP